MPHRAPGSPGQSKQFLTGKPIHYYRPKGSPEVKHLIDEGFQAFNAGRLSEACQIFSEKMLAPDHETTIGLTIAGAMTPAGLNLVHRAFDYLVSGPQLDVVPPWQRHLLESFQIAI